MVFFRPFHRCGLFIISLFQLWSVTTADVIDTSTVSTGGASYAISPFWVQAMRSFVFVDRNAGTINRYAQVTNTYFSVKIVSNFELSFVIPVKGQANTYAVGMGKGVGLVVWDGTSSGAIKPKFKISVITTEPLLIKAGKTDSNGVLWLAVSGNTTGSGSVRVMDVDGTVTTAITGIGISNTMAWGFDYQRLFYIEGNKIIAHTANLKQKTLTVKWEILDTVKSKAACFPVDIGVDMFGFVILTCSGTVKYVLEIRPRDSKFAQIELPYSTNATDRLPSLISPIYGGLSQEDFYITTAGPKPHMQYYQSLTDGGSGPVGIPVVLPSHWP